MKREVFLREDISARAKGIYAFLLSYDKEINKNSLVLHFKEGRDSLSTAFKELVNNNYIAIVKKRDEEGKFAGSEIKIL